MGIMNHENVVINNAGTVAYYGEDGGTHMVYKYVMDTPNDLSSGNLYVLKLDQGLTPQEIRQELQQHGFRFRIKESRPE
jgi:secreted PhoX family phosphatase